MIVVLACASHAFAIWPETPRNVDASDAQFGDRIQLSWGTAAYLFGSPEFHIYRSAGGYTDCSSGNQIAWFSGEPGRSWQYQDTSASPGRRYTYAVGVFLLNGFFCSAVPDNQYGYDSGSRQLPAAPIPAAGTTSSYHVSTSWGDYSAGAGFGVNKWRLYRSTSGSPCGSGTLVWESPSRAARLFDDTSAPPGQNVHYSLIALDELNLPGLCSAGWGVGYRQPAPTISTQPPPTYTAFEGQSVTMSVVGAGADLHYQWQRSGVNISGATAASYVRTAQASDSGVPFRVQVFNGAGYVFSINTYIVSQGAPVITQHPQPQQVFLGQGASFSCAASGQQVSYRWQVNGAYINGANSATLNVTANDMSMNGFQYRCVATNPAGSVASNYAALTINPPPAITSQPSAQSAFVNGSASFSCAASGIGVSYSWDRNGQLIGGASSPTLVLQNIQASDSGAQFRCRASNLSGTAYSNYAALTVNGTPSITQQPNDQTASIGQAVVFGCLASGVQVSYQWERNGASISGATAPSYTLPNAQISDSGALFRCRASNPSGAVYSRSALLTVTAAPQITTQPTDQSVFAGQTAVFTCAASGQGVSIQWQRAGQDIPGAVGGTLSVSAVTGADSGAQFRCRASNSSGSAFSVTATLTVFGLPRLTQVPASLSLTDGQSAVFGCHADGVSVSYQWFRNGQAIAGAVEEVLNLGVVHVSDHGAQFVCRVANPAGAVQSEPAVLTVNAAPSPCQELDISSIKQTETLGAGELEKLALQAIKRLKRAKARGNPALTARLQASARHAEKRMTAQVNAASVNLSQLPDHVLVCPGSTSCTMIDNRAVISQHINAILELENTALRSLNRATRLVSKSVEEARRLTARTAAKIRQTAERLVGQAQGLPPEMHACAG